MKSDFSIDPAFVPKDLRVPPRASVAVRKDDSTLLGLELLPSTNHARLMLLHPDLTFDSAYAQSNRVSGSIVSSPTRISPLADGAVLLLDSSQTLQRILPGGGRDRSFATQLGVSAFLPLSIGGVLFGDSTALKTVKPDGKRDTNVFLRISSGFAPFIRAFALDAAGNILVGGSFTAIDSNVCPRIARLSPDLKVDPTFQSQVGTNYPKGSFVANSVRAILPLPDGDIMIGGDFSEVSGKPRALIARLKPDGELREEFNPKLKGSVIEKIALLPDGNLVVQGIVTNIDGTPALCSLFKLNLQSHSSLPPFVQIISPTNGAQIEVTDAVPPIRIDVRAYDPDGFLRPTRLEIDGQPALTNKYGNFSYTQWISTPGDHQITAFVEDESGLVSSNSVTFTVLQGELPATPVSVKSGSDGISIIYAATHKLQMSDDLINWIDVVTTRAVEGPFSEHKVTNMGRGPASVFPHDFLVRSDSRQ